MNNTWQPGAIPNSADSATKKCPNCGEILNIMEKFCHACGQKADTPADSETQKCPHCGEILHKIEKFCHACGQKADTPADSETQKCPHCGEILSKIEKFCHACGAINPLSNTLCPDCGGSLVKSGETQPAAAPEKQPETAGGTAASLSSRLFHKSFEEFRFSCCNQVWLDICNDIDSYQTSERYLNVIKQALENDTLFLPQSYAFAEHNIALRDQVLRKMSARLAPDEKFVIFISNRLSGKEILNFSRTAQVVLSPAKYAELGILVTNKRIYGLRPDMKLLIESIANIHSLVFGVFYLHDATDPNRVPVLRLSDISDTIYFVPAGRGGNPLIRSHGERMVTLACLLAMESHPQGYQIEVLERRVNNFLWDFKYSF